MFLKHGSGCLEKKRLKEKELCIFVVCIIFTSVLVASHFPARIDLRYSYKTVKNVHVTKEK